MPGSNVRNPNAVRTTMSVLQTSIAGRFRNVAFRLARIASTARAPVDDQRHRDHGRGKHQGREYRSGAHVCHDVIADDGVCGTGPNHFRKRRRRAIQSGTEQDLGCHEPDERHGRE